MFEACFDSENWTTCFENIRFALVMARQANKEKLLNDIFNIIYNKVVELDFTDKKFLTINLIELLINNNYKLIKIEKIINRLSECNDYRMPHAFDVCIEYHLKQNKTIDRQQIYYDYGNKIIKNLNNCDESDSFMLLNKALEFFQKAGNENNVKEVMEILANKKMELLDKNQYSIKIELDCSLMHDLKNEIKNGSNIEEDLNCFIAQICFLNKKDIEKDISNNCIFSDSIFHKEKLNRKGYTTAMIPSLINNTENSEKN